jgi:uncharacterized protein
MLKDQINKDLKKALLEKNQQVVSVLRGLKSAILYVEVSKGNREEGLSDNDILEVLSKESKKRKESADLYVRGGNQERAKAELEEKAIIDKYLPEQLSDEEIDKIVSETISGHENLTMADMGKIIGLVKSKVGSAGDGSKIATIVKAKLSNQK